MTMETETKLRPGIRWGRVIVGAIIIELVLGAVSGLFYGLDRLDDLASWVVPATVLAALLGGAWAGRGTGRPVLHGALAGVISVLIYAVIGVIGLFAAPEQVTVEAMVAPISLAAHATKVIAGAVGGWLVARRGGG